MPDEIPDGNTRQPGAFEGPDELSFEAFLAVKKAGLNVPGTTQIDKPKLTQRIAENLMKRAAPLGTDLPPFVLDEVSEVGRYIRKHHPQYRMLHINRRDQEAAMVAFVADVRRCHERQLKDGTELENYRLGAQMRQRLPDNFEQLDAAAQINAVQQVTDQLIIEANAGDDNAIKLVEFMTRLSQ